LPGSLAQQPCPAALPGNFNFEPCVLFIAEFCFEFLEK
jgi:hypothetical protein